MIKYRRISPGTPVLLQQFIDHKLVQKSNSVNYSFKSNYVTYNTILLLP